MRCLTGGHTWTVGRGLRLALGARHGGYAGRDRDLLGGGLVAKHVELPGGGPDELDVRFVARARQRGALGKESVAGMNRVDAVPLRDLDDGLDVRDVLDVSTRRRGPGASEGAATFPARLSASDEAFARYGRFETMSRATGRRDLSRSFCHRPGGDRCDPDRAPVRCGGGSKRPFRH